MSDDAPVIGRPINRVDGVQKVTGGARYAAEFASEDVAHAVIVQSTVARGTITRLDTGDAERSPGVVAVLTHRNAPRLPQGGKAAINPPAGRTLSLLQDDVVHYNGQPIAVVVADSYERAVEAAARVRVSYAVKRAVLKFDEAKRETHKPAKDGPSPSEKSWGDAAASLDAAPVRIDAVYRTAMEHHNPMEPHATIARWDGDQLTLHDATQYVSGVRDTVAKTLGIDAANVRVINPFVGGGFGCKGSAWSHVVLCAMAARKTGRAVKLVLARPQMFGPVGGRPCTEQHVSLGASRDGKLAAIRHDVIAHTSEMEDFVEPSSSPTRALYACANGFTRHRLATMNVGVATFQRAPGECTGTFALESAMDELAYSLGMDPLALRLANYAELEPSSGKPWSSKKLRECYADAAQRFGWTRRTAAPRSMREGRWLVGWGMATATYPAHRQPAAALARLMPDGSILVQSGSQDLGTGTYTVMTQIAAQTLGVPVERVRFELGDTTMPRAPVSGGSMTVASVGPAVQAACLELRKKIESGAKAGGEPLEGRAETKAAEESSHASRSFGALFVEVRVDEALGLVRVPRIVGTYSVGRLMNEKTALSQLQGGIVWGLGQALFEQSLLDPRYGRFANGNLAEYHVPVNADVQAIDVAFVEEDDTNFNPLGARGIGEIGITGVAGAVANAVFHATGKRIRDLPITLDKLL